MAGAPKEREDCNIKRGELQTLDEESREPEQEREQVAVGHQAKLPQ